MDSDRFSQALGRLEAAIDRLGHLVPQTGSSDASDVRLAALEERHRKLREGASDALARLDRLIGAAPSTPHAGA